jgi:hypothetical protein
VHAGQFANNQLFTTDASFNGRAALVERKPDNPNNHKARQEMGERPAR